MAGVIGGGFSTLILNGDSMQKDILFVLILSYVTVCGVEVMNFLLFNRVLIAFPYLNLMM